MTDELGISVSDNLGKEYNSEAREDPKSISNLQHWILRCSKAYQIMEE